MPIPWEPGLYFRSGLSLESLKTFLFTPFGIMNSRIARERYSGISSGRYLEQNNGVSLLYKCMWHRSFVQFRFTQQQCPPYSSSKAVIESHISLCYQISEIVWSFTSRKQTLKFRPSVELNKTCFFDSPLLLLN